MEREPEEPVGEGVGLITCWGLGVPGGPEPMPLCAPPLELSLLFCPISSWCGEGDACDGCGDGLGAWPGLLLGGDPPALTCGGGGGCCCSGGTWCGEAGGKGCPEPGLGEDPPGQGRFGSGYWCVE